VAADTPQNFWVKCGFNAQYTQFALLMHSAPILPLIVINRIKRIKKEDAFE